MKNIFTRFIVHGAPVGLLALALSAPVFAGSFSSPIPVNIRAAYSGFGLSVGSLSQHYVETVNGTTPDAESGSIPTYTLTLGRQGAHLGIETGVRYSAGNDNYNGNLQNKITGALTPYQGTTNNRMLDFSAALKLGFSPAENLAIIPEVFAGRYRWRRRLPGPNGSGYTESYANSYSGFGTSVDYQLGQFVFSGDYRMGTTSRATMVNSTGTFQLGNHGYLYYGARITWVTTRNVRIFLTYDKTKFGYAVPNESRSTTQYMTYLGVRIS